MPVIKQKSSFLELAKGRRTTYEFSGRKIGKEDISLILEAGRWAPSSHNAQDWKFIAVQADKKIDSLMKLCHYGGFYSNPPLIIALVAEPLYQDKPGFLRGDAKELAAYHKYLNIAMAASNMIYEAESLGISTCILSAKIEEANKELGVPAGSEAALLLGFGYPKEGAYQKAHERKELSKIVSYEKY